MEKTSVTIEALINAPLEKVWECWTEGKHVVGWNFASEDWYCPAANNDLKPGGKFTATMAAKDGSMSFEFWGTYQHIENQKLIQAEMGDGRKLEVLFEKKGDQVLVTELFETETTNSIELQKKGWQAILNNFKKYCEK
jgi:uncharacterized protein YndB with AHSA1/START domain